MDTEARKRANEEEMRQAVKYYKSLDGIPYYVWERVKKEVDEDFKKMHFRMKCKSVLSLKQNA